MKEKILAILPESIGGRLTTSSIIDGFKQNNFEVYIIDELKENLYKEQNYKYLIGYDFSPIKFKIENNLNFPVITYFSDVIQSKTSGVGWDKFQKELKNKDTHVFYWDRELSKKESYNYQPHFVNCEIYKNFKKPETDVLFMGRLDTDIRLETYLTLNKQLKNVKFKWYAIEKHFKDALSRCKSEEEKEIINNTYSGFIDNEEDMAEAINESKIVYNINAQGISSLNYRTIQTMACERLLISDKRAELDLFDNILPTYDNIQDLIEKIKYYLSNEDEYLKITKMSRNYILKNHNSFQCIKNILSIVQDN